MRMAVFTVVVLAVFPAEALAASAISSGTEVVGVGTSIFSPAGATGSWCLGAQVDGVANNGYAYGPGGGPASPCTSVFFIKNEARSAESWFYNYYDRRTFNGVGPPAPIAKFPAPVTTFGNSSASGFPPGSSTADIANAGGRFTSSQSTVRGVVVYRSASLRSTASVDIYNANGGPGLSTSEVFDPWIFTPDEDTVLTLDVSLADVMMSVQGASPFYGGATLEAFGAFGVGDVPGTSILGAWDYFMEVDNNSMFSASSIPVFSMEIPLTAGVEYWMTDDLETAATVVTPEPGVMALFATGMLAMSGLRLYRRRKGEADEWPQPFGGSPFPNARAASTSRART
jgi:hypothetical protein